MQGNEQQNQAILWDSGPALILAGPGSGKTFTIVERIRYLIEVRRVDPSHILVITFTKAAARQMRDRFYTRMSGEALPVNFGTFHAVFLHILQNSRHYDSGSILSEHQKKEFLRIAINCLPPMQQRQEDWEETLLSEIGYIKNLGRIPPDFQSAVCSREEFGKIFMEFQKLLREMGKLDLDDFAAAVRHLFRSDPAALSCWQERFSYILVDEFQDINAMQYEVVKLLAGKKQNLFVVGDDDQAIYGFRGSDPAIMKQFLRDFPNARQICLSVNYRSLPGIVETAGKLISVNQERFPKKIIAGKQDSAARAAHKIPGEGAQPEGNAFARRAAADRTASFAPLSRDGSVLLASFESRESQMKSLAGLIGSCYGMPEEKRPTIAAIFRTNTDAGLMAEALAQAKIPFGMKEKIKSPYAHPVCQDLLSYLLFAKKERSRKHFFRIMNKPCRYISRQRIWQEQVSFPALCRAYADKPYMQRILGKLQADTSRLIGMDLYAAVHYIRKGMGYDEWLKKELSDEKQEEAMQMAAFFTESVKAFASLEAFCEHIDSYERALEEAPAKVQGADKDSVQLITMHGAKGLEFDVVFLPDCNEGTVPHKKSAKPGEVEEERRMFYVGMTRAKERLYISWVAGTKEEPGFPSRFLAECGYREPYRGF